MTASKPQDISTLSISQDSYQTLVDSDSALARVAEQLPAHVVDTGEASGTNQDATAAPPRVSHNHATHD